MTVRDIIISECSLETKETSEAIAIFFIVIAESFRDKRLSNIAWRQIGLSSLITREVRVFSHDVTAAILVSQNNETAAMLVSQTSPLGVELFSYVNAFFCYNRFAYI